MSPEVAPHIKKYTGLFERHLQELDGLIIIILKAHLIIEGALDNIIDLIFFHPKYVHDARLGFSNKVAIARAYGLRKHENVMWEMILTINTLRNKIAHKLDGKERRVKMDELRKLYIAEAGSDLRKRAKDAEDNEIAFYACAMCTGFIAELEADSVGLRKLIDSIDRDLNPDQPHYAYTPEI